MTVILYPYHLDFPSAQNSPDLSEHEIRVDYVKRSRACVCIVTIIAITLEIIATNR